MFPPVFEFILSPIPTIVDHINSGGACVFFNIDNGCGYRVAYYPYADIPFPYQLCEFRGIGRTYISYYSLKDLLFVMNNISLLVNWQLID